MTNQRIRVGVIFGGQSSEHAVSCVSAGSILANLDPERFEVVPIGITAAGTWVLGDGDTDRLSFAGGTLPAVTGGPELGLVASEDHSVGRLIPANSSADVAALASLETTIDVAFPVLHGPFGEDGTVQGLLEMVGIPYVGAGVLASAAGMDKEFTKKLLLAAGLPVGPFTVLRPRQDEPDPEVIAALGLPLFVKPARGGSSIGITKVTSLDALPGAIAAAREHDPKVIIEAALVGREIECGVLERPDGTIGTSVLAEIDLSAQTGDAGMYDFETKYLNDVAQYQIPALLEPEVAELIRSTAVLAFDAIDGQGLARVDFFLTADGPIVNEINTMPGFTTTSMYPQMWASTGMSYPELVSTLIDTALARGTGLR